MPTVDLKIGTRTYTVACEEGQESSVKGAAAVVDAEVKKFSVMGAHIPEDQLFAMAGLVLADRIKALDNRLAIAEDKVESSEAELEFLRNQPVPEPEVRTELSQEAVVLMEHVTTQLEDLAAELEKDIPSDDDQADETRVEDTSAENQPENQGDAETPPE